MYLWSASQAHRQQYDVAHDLAELRTARLKCEQFVVITPTCSWRGATTTTASTRAS